MDWQAILTSSFFWGFMLGLVFCVLSLFALFRSQGELKRFRRMLSDKLEIDADQIATLKKEVASLKSENENMRIKIGAGAGGGNNLQSLERHLEIYARSEKAMMVSAPGFAGAWENAKSAAMSEIEDEERGKSLPRRIFQKLFAPSKEAAKNLPQKGEIIAAGSGGDNLDG
ncbi:MAG: hypothetical protein IT576_01020 [Verrucomicrobiales bacterium]|nr:hypothetical protein [Verrucomicrobiales bacterium]